MRDITTGALRRKRGAADDLDLSDEEDATARRREAKRREFARMRRELLRDEALGKIAEDKKKQAFLKSIEDRDEAEEDGTVVCEDDPVGAPQSQSQPAQDSGQRIKATESVSGLQRKKPLEPSAADLLNRPPVSAHRLLGRKSFTLEEIREQVSFLIEEPNSQFGGTSRANQPDDETATSAAYFDLDRHLHQEDEENGEIGEGLADLIVDDDDSLTFRKPALPTARAPAHERRTKANVVDRLSLLRQASSSSNRSQQGSKLAFFGASASGPNPGPSTTTALSRANSSSSSSSFQKPSLIRRATSTASISSLASDTSTSTGRLTAPQITERGAVEAEKEVIRKGQGGKRSAINYYAQGRVEAREKVRQVRVGKTPAAAAAAKKNMARRKGLLGKGFGSGTWE
jgi:mediator of replication checkpoint protein 1